MIILANINNNTSTNKSPYKRIFFHTLEIVRLLFFSIKFQSYAHEMRVIIHIIFDIDENAFFSS